MFKVTNGAAVPVKSIYEQRGIVTDIALQPPKIAHKMASKSKAPANGYE